jgi:hypothetical protein
LDLVSATGVCARLLRQVPSVTALTNRAFPFVIPRRRRSAATHGVDCGYKATCAACNQIAKNVGGAGVSPGDDGATIS